MRFNRYDKYAGMTFGEASIARAADRKANAARNAEKKARKEAQAKTCQCCGRAIFAETGTIAHHGYERPGSGWQTASCMGAKHLPFEVSRDRLGVMIAAIESQIERTRKHLANVKAEKVALSFHYTRRSQYSSQSVEHWVEVTRSTFDMVKEAYAMQMVRHSVYRFDDVKKRTIASLESDIKRNEEFRKEQQTRFDGWKPTHQWKDKTWVAL